MQPAFSEASADHLTADAAEDTPILVSVVIPCRDQGRFLAEAIESALDQTYRWREVIVVDDGSSDDTPAVAARYPQVRTIAQPNQGLAAARNTGIRHSSGDYVVFLDADDRLLPGALEIGAKQLGEHPGAAFVSGRHRRIAADGSVLPQPKASAVRTDHYLALLSGNYIGMHATVMYRRDALEAVRGFDPSLARCEDYDLYLRLARRFAVACHDEVVAEYRLHGANMSQDSAAMLTTALRVLRSEARRAGLDAPGRHAYRKGLAAWRAYYARDFLHALRQSLRERAGARQALGAAIALLRYSPGWLLKHALRRSWRTFLTSVRPQRRRVRWGDLRRLTPFSRRFGYDRGLPVDRYYIEGFLATRRDDIRGHVLEVGDRTYTTRFGAERVTRSDVLHVSPGNPMATVVADLSSAEHIAANSFDCIVLTQTLQLIYDVAAAARTLHRILKPGGVLLATVPGVSQLEDGEWASRWCWSFTRLSAAAVFSGFSDVDVRSCGNVLAATAFLQGIAAEELRAEELEHQDPLYPIVIMIRAVKPPEA